MSAAAKRIRTSFEIDPNDYATLGLNPETARSTVTQDLIKWFAHLVAHGARTADRLFSRNEWNALADALNGHLWTPAIPAKSALPLEVESALAAGLGEKWSVDGPDLLAKLNKLDPIAAEAVAVALRWFWDNHESIDPSEDPWWTIAFRTGRRGRREP